jgi:hypothetical protein
LYVKKEKGNVYQKENMPYNFNLDVLITAVFEPSNYDEGLKFLSDAISFFQRKNVFNT